MKLLIEQNISGEDIARAVSYALEHEITSSFSRKIIINLCRNYLRVGGTLWFKEITPTSKAGNLARKYFPELFDEPTSITFIRGFSFQKEDLCN